MDQRLSSAMQALRKITVRVRNMLGVLTALLILVVLPATAVALDQFSQPGQVFAGGFAGPHEKFQRFSIVEARAGYMWGVNQILLRDGDNANLPPGKREVSLESPAFGLQGEMFTSNDLSIRAQGWINLPQGHQGVFYFDRTARSWNTTTRYIAGDIAAVYHFGPVGSFYGKFESGGVYNGASRRSGPATFAGIMAGFRYNNLDCQSTTIHDARATFHDFLHIYIPYLGVYYADGDFMGSVLRLEVLASPLTLSKIDSRETLLGAQTTIDGHSVMGCWVESLLGWFWPVTDKALVGAFAKFNFLELSGGATVWRSPSSTRFSLDGRQYIFITGLTANYSF